MSDWQAVQNLLCIRLDTLGDVLMTSPAIRALKYSAPSRHITLLTSASGAAAGRHVPEVDEVMTWDAPWLKAARLRTDSGADLAFCSELKKRKFDGAVIFTVFSQSPLPAALFCLLADIPRRLACCRENPYQLLTDWLPETEPQQGIRHEVERQLRLVEAIGCMTENQRLSFRVLSADRCSVQQMLIDAGLNQADPWLVLHPGSTAASRRYPVESFAAAANLLLSRGFQIVLSGSADEQSLVDTLRQMLRGPNVNLAGELSLGQLAALLEQTPMLLTNNTGPAHLAAAVGTPVVDLYALTNPQHTPWGVPSRVLFQDVPCKYCFKSTCPEGHHRCLREVTPEQVVAATLDLLCETARTGKTSVNATRSSDFESPRDGHRYVYARN